MRYEIKIPFIKNDLSLVLNSLRQIRGISEQYKERYIHSIYFDTKDLQLARHNIEGLSKRYKFRIRWYDHQFKKYNYEIKKKDNKLKLNEISMPIQIANGYIIIKLNDKRELNEKIDIEVQLENLIKIETNRQLNNFSMILFKRLKKNIEINEF